MQVAEKFISINGEGLRAGQPCAFIRFAGCNLSCSWCDTTWANGPDCPVEDEDIDQLVDWVASSGVLCATLTGGEPLLQPRLAELADALLAIDGLRVEIETNGAVDIEPIVRYRQGLGDASCLALTLDCKTPSSGMSGQMLWGNYEVLCSNDAVKFVCASHEDLAYAKNVIDKYNLQQRTNALLSPVFGSIEPVEIVEFMLKSGLNGARLQLQMHKIVWPPEMRGV